MALGVGLPALPRSQTLTRLWHSQIRTFAASGVVNTLTDYVVFMSLTRIFSVPLGRVWIAKLLSGGVAMAVSFLLNRNWVFASRDARVAPAGSPGF